MEHEHITVSVRLSRAEYDALQAIAAQTYNTMSGVIRRLIGRETERGCKDGQSNGKTEKAV